MKFDRSLFFDTVKRVLWDLWMPGVTALGITIYRTILTPSDWFTFASSFFTTMFFAAGYFGYIQRAKKNVIDQRNHHDVSGKQDKVIKNLQSLADDLSGRQQLLVTRLEGLADELVGHTTGGDGYCYVFLPRINADSVFELVATVESKYALQELRCEISRFESLDEKMLEYQRTGDTAALIKSDLSLAFGTALPNTAIPKRCNFSVNGQTRIRLHLNWQARNGMWYQRVQLENVNGTWLHATFVKKNDRLLHSAHDTGYPLDSDGKPIFHEYDGQFANSVNPN